MIVLCKPINANFRETGFWQHILFADAYSQTFNSTPLDFVINKQAGQKQYFFKIIPPTNTCFITSTSDTATTTTETMSKPAIVFNGSTLQVSPADVSISYVWQIKDATGNWTNINPPANGSSYKPVSTGTFRVKASRGKCTDYSNEQAVVFTAVDPVVDPNDVVLLYPSPTTGRLVIGSLRLADKWTTLDIVALESGQKVGSFSLVSQTKLTVHLDGLSNGIYLAVLRRQDGTSLSIKFVKM